MIEILGGSERPKKKMMIIAGAVVCVALLALLGYFIFDYIKLKQDPNAANKETVTRVTDKVDKLFLVPESEATVVVIDDKEKFSKDPFFAKIENGDYILIYAKDKFAVVYRESANKVVTAGPVNLPEDKAAAPEGTAPAEEKK